MRWRRLKLLRELLGEVLLRPTSESVVAELRGNVEGLLPLEKALTGFSGSGGLLLKVPTTLFRFHRGVRLHLHRVSREVTNTEESGAKATWVPHLLPS